MDSNTLLYTSKLTKSELEKLVVTGVACRICDRKFILRDSYRQYAGEIHHYEQEQESIEADLGARFQRAKELQADIKHYRELIRQEETKNMQTASAMQLKLDEIEQEKIQTRKEKEFLEVKVANRKKEVHELKS